MRKKEKIVVNEFEDFEGPDKWQKFERLRIKMHEAAVKEYFAEIHAEAKKKGERSVVSFKHKLKDGTYLSKEDLDREAKETGASYYPINESPTQRKIRLLMEEAAEKRKNQI